MEDQRQEQPQPHPETSGDDIEQYPDEFLPLHRPEVRRATGITDKPLKDALLNNPEHYPPDAFQIHPGQIRPHIRFNPYRYIKALERKKEQWAADQKDHGITCEDKSGGHSGVTARAEKSVSPLKTNPEAHYLKTPPAPKSSAPLQGNTSSGSERLKQLLQERQRTRQEPSEN